MGYRAPLPFIGALGSTPIGDQGGFLSPLPFIGAFGGASGVVTQAGFKSLLAMWLGGNVGSSGEAPSLKSFYKPVFRPRRRS